VPAADSTLSLYMEHRGELLKFANRIVRDCAGAEDVVQEAYLRFSARRRQSEEIAQPVHYLYRIVRNLALDWLSRASANAPDMVPVPTLENIPHDVPSVERVLYYRDELRILGEAVAELPERTQIAFRMYRVERRTLQEIADRLDVSVVRVHQLVKEATLHCALRLSGDED